ncbi:MAG: hypothetical protein ACI8QY_000360 [bacterium]|jgi:hypothetical protein
MNMKKNKIYINLHNKLALPEASSSSRALLAIFHISLAINWVFIFTQLYPIAGLVPAALVLAIEYKRKTPFTQTAFNFALKRYYLHISLIVATCIYIFLMTGKISPMNQAWFLLCYILIPLSAYDAYCTFRGGLGLKVLRPLLETIRKRA